MRKVTATLFPTLLLGLSVCGEPTGGGGREDLDNFDDGIPSSTVSPSTG